MPVWDQFGNRLAPVYGDEQNVAIEEYVGSPAAWHNMNQNMKTDGTYGDPVGITIRKPENWEVEKWGFEHMTWIEGQVPPLPSGGPESANIPVRVGGHYLVGGTGTRTVTWTAPDKVKITWPP